MLNIGSLNRIFLCWWLSWWLSAVPSSGRLLLRSALISRLRGGLCSGLRSGLRGVLWGAIALFASVTLAAPPAIAAQIEAAPSSITQSSIPQSPIDGADIAAEKVDQFAQAYLQVLQLLSDRESEIPAAETTAEALKIEQSIEADAIAIIQNSGLSTPEYMQILGLASQDSAFQDKVLGRMDESAEDS